MRVKGGDVSHGDKEHRQNEHPAWQATCQAGCSYVFALQETARKASRLGMNRSTLEGEARAARGRQDCHQRYPCQCRRRRQSLQSDSRDQRAGQHLLYKDRPFEQQGSGQIPGTAWPAPLPWKRSQPDHVPCAHKSTCVIPKGMRKREERFAWESDAWKAGQDATHVIKPLGETEYDDE